MSILSNDHARASKRNFHSKYIGELRLYNAYVWVSLRYFRLIISCPYDMVIEPEKFDRGSTVGLVAVTFVKTDKKESCSALNEGNSFKLFAIVLSVLPERDAYLVATSSTVCLALSTTAAAALSTF